MRHGRVVVTTVDVVVVDRTIKGVKQNGRTAVDAVVVDRTI